VRRECLSFWGLFGGSRVGVGVVAGDRGRTRTGAARFVNRLGPKACATLDAEALQERPGDLPSLRVDA
jgi:hypothetical protein